MDIETAIGQRMADLRNAAGRSQETVAAKLGKRQATISKWENGHIPSLVFLARFAEAIDVTLADVLQPVLSDPTVEDDPADLARRLARLLGDNQHPPQ